MNKPCIQCVPFMSIALQVECTFDRAQVCENQKNCNHFLSTTICLHGPGSWYRKTINFGAHKSANDHVVTSKICNM